MNKNYVFLGAVVILVVIGAYFFTKSIQAPTDILNNEGAIKLQNEIPQPTDVVPSATPLTTNPKKYMNDSDVKTLDIQVIQAGTGTTVSKNGDKLSMNYTGMFLNGTKFDSNVDPKFQHVQPFEFILGVHGVIDGWDKALVGRKVGDVLKLTIPSDLAYGSTGRPGIPPNAALVFDVELLKIIPSAK